MFIFVAMSKFSTKHSIKAAEKALVHTLPIVKIDGETYRITQFAGDVQQIQQAMAIAEELLPFGLGKINGGGVVSQGMRLQLALPCLAAMMLVDSDGSLVMQDVDDFGAFMDLSKTEEGKAAQMIVLDKSGINQWLIDSATKAREAKEGSEPTEPPTPEDVAIKN